MKVQVFHQGQERQQVIVIDDFADDAGALVDAAACETFAAVHAYYPGVRAPVEESYYSGLEQKIGALVCDAFGGDSLTVTGACYSLVTTPPAALQVIQRLPHYDGTDPAQLAILHYLHGPEMV